MQASPATALLDRRLLTIRQNTLGAFAIFAAAAVLVYFSIAFSREVGRVAAIWPLNAFALAFMAHRPRNSWPILLAIVFCANASVNAYMGDMPFRAIALSLANSAEIGICGWLLFRPGLSFDISRLRSLTRFILVAGVLGPCASAVIAAISLSDTAPLLETAKQWVLADALGMLVFGPALLALKLGGANEFTVRPKLADLALSPAVLAGALMLVFGQKSYPLLFCVPPALMLLTFRLGVNGAAVGILATAIVAIAATLSGFGPIQLVKGDENAKLHTLQAFLALISVTTLPLAAALAEGRRALAARDAINAELRTAQQEAAIAYAEAELIAQRYKELTDYSSDILVRFGPGGVISHASPAVRMLGIAPEEAIGLSTVDFAAPEDQAFAQKVIDELFSGNEPDPNIRREFRVRRPDGTILWLEGSPTIIRDEAGAPIEVVSIYRDITRRRELEEKLSEARKIAEAATEAKAAFLANMSHEIRTPLNSIIGFSRLLKGAKGLTPAEARYADIVASCSSSLLALVNDILDLSKFEARAAQLERRPVCMSNLVEQVCEEVRVLADAKALSITYTNHGDVAAAYIGDPTRLSQILRNLLNNAVKFTDIGSVDVSLAALPPVEGAQTLRFEIKDSGIGIADERLSSLFSPFVQGDSTISRRYGGTGLGLSIVREIITAMNGRCGAQSDLGRGSTFWFEVDLEIAHGETEETSFVEALPTQRRHILVVDDVDLNRELAGILLRDAGHDVDFASDGAEAVSLAQAWPYDLIFMDVQMPGMDGLSATRAIRNTPGIEAVSIVAMTAQALPDQIAACLAAGMNDYVAKPLEARALQIAIAKWTGAPAGAPAKPFDSAMDDLRKRFVERSKDDLRHIGALLADGRDVDDDTRTRIHRLAGTAGAFGYADAGAAARGLDERLSQYGALKADDFDPLLKALQAMVAA